jgi:hypothetical protein
MEEGVKFMKYVKGGVNYTVLGTCAIIKHV